LGDDVKLLLRKRDPDTGGGVMYSKQGGHLFRRKVCSKKRRPGLTMGEKKGRGGEQRRIYLVQGKKMVKAKRVIFEKKG